MTERQNAGATAESSAGECSTSKELFRTIEAAALISLYGDQSLRSRQPLPASLLQVFWSASRRRLNGWRRVLAPSPLELVSPQSATSVSPEKIVEEIFTSEMLTRVAGAWMVACDLARGTSEAEPIARNVLLGHLEARRLALKWMLGSEGRASCDLRRMNRLRRRIERWTDLLLGHFVVQYPVADFACDAERAWEFGFEQIEDVGRNQMAMKWSLFGYSLRAAFPPKYRGAHPHAREHAEIAAAVMDFLTVVSDFPATDTSANSVGDALAVKCRPPADASPRKSRKRGTTSQIRFADTRRQVFLRGIPPGNPQENHGDEPWQLN